VLLTSWLPLIDRRDSRSGLHQTNEASPLTVQTLFQLSLQNRRMLACGRKMRACARLLSVHSIPIPQLPPEQPTPNAGIRLAWASVANENSRNQAERMYGKLLKNLVAGGGFEPPTFGL
jgi:hypothetical protein